MFGQNLWRDGGDKSKLIITEGELDCLSVSKVQQNKWPVVSVPSGATSAKKYIKKELDWFSKFSSIILMYDEDEAGKQAVIDCASILPVKKVKIATLPAKDPSELLQSGRGEQIVQAMWEAKAYTPQGIIEGSETKDLLLKDDFVETVPYQWNGFNKSYNYIL